MRIRALTHTHSPPSLSLSLTASAQPGDVRHLTGGNTAGTSRPFNARIGSLPNFVLSSVFCPVMAIIENKKYSEPDSIFPQCLVDKVVV